jgi:hypothetical protein
MRKGPELFFRELPKLFEIGQLGFGIEIRLVEPVTAVGLRMNTKRSAAFPYSPSASRSCRGKTSIPSLRRRP